MRSLLPFSPPGLGAFPYATLAASVVLACLTAYATPLRAQETGAIAGTIVSPDQRPLAGARVEAFASGQPIARVAGTDQGAFFFERLAPGRWRVVVSRIGYAQREDTVMVVAGQTAQLRIVLAAVTTQLDQVTTTASRRQEKILDAPASISVITAEEVAERPALTVMDNVRGEPGVDVAQAGLIQSAIVARGFNNVFSGTLLTLVDNRFASVPSLRVNVPYMFTASNEDIERIEVLLGPAAALYGPNSANGVLHIITKSPFTSQGSTLTLDAGERGVLRVAGRHAGVVGSSLGFKLTGEYMQGRDWQFVDPGEPAVFPNTPNTPRSRVGQPNRRDWDIDRYGGEARLDWRLNDNTEWINSYGLVRVGNSVELTGANGAAQIRDWTIQSLQSRLRAGRLFAQVFANLSDAGNEDSTDVGGTFILRTGQPIVDRSRAIGTQLQHSVDFGTRNSVVYGLDYIFTNPRTGGTINGRNEEDDDVSEIGGYFQSTTRLTPMWELLLAARVDQHSQLEGTFFSPRAAVVFKPAEDQSVRLTFNRAYSTPANFGFFLDLLQAGNISGLPFNVRAVGVPEDGFRFRRDCAGGVGSLCMRSPFTPAGAGGPGAFVPANAAAYYPAALQVALAGGLRQALINGGLTPAQADATINRLATFNAVGAGVTTNLTYITNQTTVEPTAVRDLERLKASFTNVLELGYKGTVGGRLFLAADAWYQRRENFITPAANFTPNTLLNGQTLAPALVAHLTPTLGAGGATAVAPVVAAALARIPLGTVVPDSRVTTNGDIAFTYQTIEKSIDLHGADLAFDMLLAGGLTMIGTYSWVSDVIFEDIESGQQPLTLNAPDHKGSLGVRYDYMQRKITGELRARYQNTFPVNSAVFVTGVSLPAPGGGTYQYQQPPTSTFVDAQATWRGTFGVNRGVLFSVSATNLLDRKVPLFAGVPEIGRLVMTRLQFTL
jgi:outer membrane receptor for ferrienterochelin and colicins